MKRSLKTYSLLLPLCLLCALPASAVTEADVQAAVDAQGRDAVSGNLFLWFLCAIAFLKISTKLDNILHSLGLGAGRPPGSMLTEALMAMRGLQIGKAFATGTLFGGRNAAGPAGTSKASPGGMSGGLAGAVGRKVTGDTTAALAGTSSGGWAAGIGSGFYNSSLGKEGGFASQVIGSIATGQSPGYISGEDASTALDGYFAHESIADAAALEADAAESQTVPATPLAVDGSNDAVPVSPGYEAEVAARFAGTAAEETQPSVPTSPSIQHAALQRVATGAMGNPTTDVEIGGGKITGKEVIPGRGSIAFAMYNAKQFEKPTGHYTVQQSLDGEKWYKVYATAAIERRPTVKDEETGRYQYEERKVAVLPKAPNRRR